MDAPGRIRRFEGGGIAMNYPIWDLTTLGGGTLIALIAVFHVFISHLAVGGGMFIWLTDRRAVKTGDRRMLDFVKRHTWFFLLLTMVFGGMTGVGIWFIIGLVQPAATAMLIHQFVFGWAIEWVFFVGEIVALLIYYYRFDHLAEKDRLIVAFLYWLFAWLSLVIINGILTFMLTPGAWLTTHEFWDGFFNPTYFPGLVFRTCMTAVMAGLFGFITAVRHPDDEFRVSMVKYCAKWLLYPLPVFLLSAYWYYLSLPEEITFRAFVLNPQTLQFVRIFLGATTLIFVGGVLQMFRSPRGLQRAITVVLIAIGLSWIGGFEYVREISRKPYVIGNFMYANSIPVADVPMLNTEGVLPHALWTSVKSVTPENRAQAGRELFRLECQGCHTPDGFRNAVAPRIRRLSYLGIVAQLTGQGKLQTYMPPFVGTAEEREALAAFLTTEINKSDISGEVEPAALQPVDEAIPPFDRKSSEYVLLAWNDLGMHTPTDVDAWFSYMPPINTIEAQLIKRGDPPKLVADTGIVLRYEVEKGFTNPSDHSAFWNHVESLFGKKLPVNTGLFGLGMQGRFTFDSTRNGFIAPGIPVLPYNDNGTFNPYPHVTVAARRASTGELLAMTRVVAPVTTESGCRNCHGGSKSDTVSGFGDETAQNILAAHDRLNKTELLKNAREGKPVVCQSCHWDLSMGLPGVDGVTHLSSAIHGWHANYIASDDSKACLLCHPGNLRSQRDVHLAMGVGCVECHGTLGGMSVSLLKGERTVSAARRLVGPLNVPDKDSVRSRDAWLGQPDCLTCHKDFQQPTSADAFNAWTKEMPELYRIRTDKTGLRCPACHGSPHAMYPATNPLGNARDNIQPLQYSGLRAPIGTNRQCDICHRKPVQNSPHHPNMDRMFRNTQLLQ
jgi:mono/diheme cytochrome c family protein